MKKFLTQKNNFVVVLLAVLAFTFSATQVRAANPGSDITPLIHGGAGHQVITGFLKIGSAVGRLADLDLRDGVNSLAQFSTRSGDTSSVFMVLNPSALSLGSGKVFVGNTDVWQQSYTLNDGQTVSGASLLQKVNVNGQIRSTALNPTETSQVCATNDGTLILCGDDPDLVVTPVNGVCGSAHGTTVSSAPTTNLCSSGTASSVSVEVNSYTWNCFGSDGGTNASCSANQEVMIPDNICYGRYDRESGSGGSCSGTYSETITGGSCGQALVCGCDIGTNNNSGAGGCTCNWQGSASICAGLGQGSCNAHSSCSWSEGQVTRTCDDYNAYSGFNYFTNSLEYRNADPDGCTNQPNCTWTSSATTTERVCTDFYAATTSTGILGDIPGCDSESSCTWGPSPVDPPETNWLSGLWGDCTNGTQTRTVTCPAGYTCPLAQPATSRSCDAGSTAGTKIICGELYRQGYLSEDLWLADNAYAQENIAPGTLDVYHSWGGVVVSGMQKSRLVTNIVKPYGLAWAEHMAFLEGTASTDNYLGSLLHNTFLPIHDLLSGQTSNSISKTSSVGFDFVGFILFVLIGIFALAIVSVVFAPLVILAAYLIRRKTGLRKTLRTYGWIIISIIVLPLISLIF